MRGAASTHHPYRRVPHLVLVLFYSTLSAMPRHRLALRAYASFHGQILVGPYADPNQVELEAWALLRQQCAHLDRAKLTPVRRFFPFGGVTLKVISARHHAAGRHVQHPLVAGAGRRGGRIGGCTCR